jgi:plastocyanin domain-containing protein
MRKAIITIGAMVLLGSATAALAEQAHKKSHQQVVNIDVTTQGFVPARIEAKVGQPVKLLVTRKTEQTCAKEIVIKDFGIKKPLPLNQPVEVTFTPNKAGKIRYACGMDMIAGVVVVE